MSTDLAQAWIVALNKYLSCVHTGGTADQRKWAWARANDALDKHLNAEHAQQAKRSKRDTIETEAVEADAA